MNEAQWQERIERVSDQLYRLTEFRIWIETNVLFPTVPDSIVHPLREQLRNAEHVLLHILYDARAIGKVAAMHKVLDAQERKT